MSQAVRVENRTQGTVVGDRIRIATSTVDRMVGLLSTARLRAGEGLWIERTSSIHMFFMRFPIDAVFVDRYGMVVRVVPNLRPWRLAFARGARDCLELPAGAAAWSRTTVGDRLERAAAAQGMSRPN